MAEHARMLSLMKALILFLALLPSVAFAQWTTEHKTLAAIAGAALLADYAQTRDIAYRQQHACANGCMHELNPLLGKKPTRGRINAYFATVAIGGYFALDNMSSESRTTALSAAAVLEIAVVGRNKHIGLSMRF